MASVTSYNRLIIVVLLCLVSNVVLSLLAISKVKRSSQDYAVNERNFLQAVNFSVTNYLSNLSTVTLNTLNHPDDSIPNPTVKCVDDLGTWSTYSGIILCRINGVVYRVGDYTEYGLVTRIDSGRVYCTSSNSVVILRAPLRRRDAVSPVETARAAAGHENSAL